MQYFGEHEKLALSRAAKLFGERMVAEGSKPRAFVHYTNVSSFLTMVESIINNKRIGKDECRFMYFYASQIQYLNDSQEYYEGLEFYERFSRGLKTERGDDSTPYSVFASSFCGERDLLSQWKYYGQDGGVAIEFDFDNDLEFWLNKDEKVLKAGSIALMRPIPLLYWHKNGAEEETKSKFGQLCDDLMHYSNTCPYNTNELLSTMCACFVKNAGFEEERESRILFFPFEGCDLSYRNSDGKIIPGIKFKMRYSEQIVSSNSSLKNKIPIKRIIVGPGPKQILNFCAIYDLLESNHGPGKYISPKTVEGMRNDASGKTGGLVSVETSDGILVSLSNIPFR